jgi:hypothetical protein
MSGSRGAVTGDGRRRPTRTLGCESANGAVIPNTIPGGSMVLLSGNFPRTFPFQSESRRGGNPNGFLTTESEKETQWLI